MAATLANIRVEPVKVTWGTQDLGYLEGDVSVKLEEKTVDITAHQTGANVLTAIRTGKSCEVTLKLKESDPAAIKKIIAGSGSSQTPGAGTSVNSWGMEKDFKPVDADAQKLVLHPVALAGTDLSRDLTFWKAYPMLDSISYSGEKASEVSITFKIFPDLSKAADVAWFVQGDSSQTFT